MVKKDENTVTTVLSHVPCPNGLNCNYNEKKSSIVDISMNNFEIKSKNSIELPTIRTDIHNQKTMFTRITKNRAVPIIMSDLTNRVGKTSSISLDGQTLKERRVNTIPELGAVGNFTLTFSGKISLKKI